MGLIVGGKSFHHENCSLSCFITFPVLVPPELLHTPWFFVFFYYLGKKLFLINAFIIGEALPMTQWHELGIEQVCHPVLGHND